MANIKRHFGQLNNSGSRVIVVFRKMPDDPNSCLIAEYDSYSDMAKADLLKIINSNKAQEVVDVYDILNHERFSTGQVMLQHLHSKNMLRKESIDNVTLLVGGTQKLSLRDANNAIDKTDTKAPTETEAPVVESSDETAQKAQAMLMQAQLLEEDATRIREEAYTLDETLRPKAKKTRKAKAKAEA